MIDNITQSIKSKIAQYTHLFDLECVEKEINTHKNLIMCIGLDGEYTLSGYESEIASSACVNNTHLFENGVAVTDCFLGADESLHNVKVRKINVGTAFDRDTAFRMVKEDVKTGNCILVYLGECRSQKQVNKNTVSEHNDVKVTCTIGVFFKVTSDFIDEFGHSQVDKLFVNSVIGVQSGESTMLEFVSVLGRFHAGKNYVIEMDFAYNDTLLLQDEFLNTLKHFDAKLAIN